MTNLIWYTAAGAGVAFIVGSATTNAMFMASLGRTQIEVAILVVVSIAADMAKVALPVAIWRAIVRRSWFLACLASLLLAGVITLSVASGTGFAALTRGSVTTLRDAAAAKLTALEADRIVMVRRLEALAAPRETSVLAAEHEAMTSDRRWQLTKQCTEASGQAHRQFCADLQRLRVEQASAGARDRLSVEERALRDQIEALRATGASNSVDPQVETLAAFIGSSPERLRAGLGLMIALVLELGAIVLVLLVAGSLLREPLEKEEPSVVPPEPSASPQREMAHLPPQVDRSFWMRQRSRRPNATMRGSDDHGA